MGDMVVLAPTRGRPERAEEMVRSFRETVQLLGTQLVLVVDKDDPDLELYLEIPGRHRRPAGDFPLSPPDTIHLMILSPQETGNLTKATNTAARRIWDDDCIIGHVGDDHVFRTKGWDVRITEVLQRPGVAYGNDLNVREYLPTAPFISSIIPRTLGWYALPSTHHMYIDNAWKEIGRGLGRLVYLNDLIIEHLHPTVGKAHHDTGYIRANSSLESDRVAFEEWMRGDYEQAMEMLRGVIR